MYKSIGTKPYLLPMPVLIIGTYNEDHTPNAMNAAYASMRDNQTVSLYLQPHRKTVENILRSKAFTIHLCDVKNRQEADFVGCLSGNAIADKVEQTGWSVTKSEDVEAPVFASFPLVMSCTLLAYDPTDGHLIGKVNNVAVEEQFLDSYDQIHVEEMDLLTYNPAQNTYHIVGECVGEAFITCSDEEEVMESNLPQPEEEERRQTLNGDRKERIARVQRMEKIMNELASLQEELNQALDHFESFKEQSDAFDAYYSSRDWMDDNEASSLGVIPEDIDQGVLTEDLPYDVLCENDALARRMRDLARKLLIR